MTSAEEIADTLVARLLLLGIGVGTDALLPDSVMDIHVNSAAAIAQSKINNLPTDLGGKALSSHSHVATGISDSTVTGQSLLKAADATAARSAISAGTSNLALGTTNTTAKAGDYQPTAANISDATATGRSVLTAADATAARTAISAGTSSLALGTTGTTACVGNDSRLSDTRTPAAGTQFYDLAIVSFAAIATRAVGAGDFPFGIKLQRACTFTSITFRANTADASGNLVAELRKNGTQVAGTPTTIAAANQVAGGSSTGSWAFAAGDILLPYITAIGTTPGTGLIVELKGTT